MSSPATLVSSTASNFTLPSASLALVCRSFPSLFSSWNSYAPAVRSFFVRSLLASSSTVVLTDIGYRNILSLHCRLCTRNTQYPARALGCCSILVSHSKRFRHYLTDFSRTFRRIAGSLCACQFIARRRGSFHNHIGLKPQQIREGSPFHLGRLFRSISAACCSSRHSVPLHLNRRDRTPQRLRPVPVYWDHPAASLVTTRSRYSTRPRSLV